RVTQRYGTLPLQGVREQKTADDLLTIGLDQVYTQLATTVLVERERFAGAALTGFDARAYFQQHVGAELLPIQQRQLVRRPPTPLEEQQLQQALGPGLAIETVEAPGEITGSLDQLDADTLAQIAQQVEYMTFSGPQLVTEAIASSFRLVVLGE